MTVSIRQNGQESELTYEAFEDRVCAGLLPPDATMHFEPVTQDRFVPLGNLALYRQLLDSPRGVMRRWLGRSLRPWLTLFVVSLECLIFLVGLLPGVGEALREHLVNWTPVVMESGQAWRMLSYGLLHAGLPHLMFNLLFLAWCGANLERVMGRRNLGVLLLGTLFGSGFFSIALSPRLPSLGVSGVDFGLLGASVVIGWRLGDLLPPPWRGRFGWSILPYLVLAILSNVAARGVDNWGHLGGLLAGLLLGATLHPVAMDRKRLSNALIGLSTIVVALGVPAAISLSGPRLLPLDSWQVDGLEAPIPAGWNLDPSFTGDQGAFSPTGQSTLVLATTTGASPATLEAAREALEAPIRVADPAAVILFEGPTDIDGHTALAMRMAFSMAGRPQILEGVALARGDYCHRAFMYSPIEDADRYHLVWERIRRQMHITDPTELSEARMRASANPGSWKARLLLAQAQRRNGQLALAEATGREAMDLAPDRPEAVFGWLDIVTVAHLRPDSDALRRIAAAFPDNPEIQERTASLLGEP